MATRNFNYSVDQKKIILLVYQYLKRESKQGSAKFSIHQFLKKTTDIFSISASTLKRLVKESNNNCGVKRKKNKKTRKVKFDE